MLHAIRHVCDLVLDGFSVADAIIIAKSHHNLAMPHWNRVHDLASAWHARVS